MILLLGIAIGGLAAWSAGFPGTRMIWEQALRARLDRWPSWHQFATHNLFIALIASFGRFSCGTISALLILINGYTLGFEFARAILGGCTPASFAALALPHGLCELVGFMLIAGWGLEAVWTDSIDLVRIGSFGQPAAGALCIVTAAVLEATVTPLCVRIALFSS